MATTGADILIDQLERYGVRHIFGMPGSHSTAIYDAIGRGGSIATVLARNEQAGAFMADGYSRVSGRHGVCIAQNGPGITNFVTSTAAAYWAHSPVVVITPETGSGTMGLGGFQETEQFTALATRLFPARIRIVSLRPVPATNSGYATIACTIRAPG